MSKTQLIEVDEETADRLRSRAASKGISVSELVAELAVESGSLAFDPDDIAELDRRWAAVQTTGNTVPNDEIVRWIQTWGTPRFGSWRDK